MIFSVSRQNIIFSVHAICMMIFCVWGSSGFAQEQASPFLEDIVIDTRVDRSDVTVGDPITYTLTIRYRPEIKPSLPGWGVNLGQFEIQDYSVTDPVKEQDYYIQESTYRIATYYAENYTIPSVTVNYRDRNGEDQSITSEPIEITVHSIAPSEAKEIRTIKPPRQIPPDYTIYYVIAGAVVGLAALIAGFIWFMKWRAKHKSLLPEPEVPLRPAHELAYEELETLINSTLLTDQRIKEYYFELSEIVRRYFSRRFGILTLERTSSEILEDLNSMDEISESLHEDIASHFSHCDWVKFAKYIPAADEIHAATDTARQFVDVTRKREEPVDDDTNTRSVVVHGTEAG
jgi:hypothetical protein